MKDSWLHVLSCPDRYGEVASYLKQKLYPSKQNGATDVVNPRTPSTTLKGMNSLVSLPSEFSLDIKAEDMGWKAEVQEDNGCTCWSKGYSVEMGNTITNQEPCYINKPLQWVRQIKRGGSRTNGDTTQNAEEVFQDFPQGFPQMEHSILRRDLDTVSGIKRVLLSTMFPIRTGVYWRNFTGGGSNYTKMLKTGIYEYADKPSGSAHACCIVGWNDELGAFKMKESMLKKWGNNEPGVFWVKYEDLHKLFRRHVSKDLIDEN